MKLGKQGNLCVFKAILKGEHDGHRIWFWCPGCDEAHQYMLGEGEGPRWTFNDDYENPTFKPSLLVTSTVGPDKKKRRCHIFITDGNIQFLNDCTHKLAGQTVPIPPPPKWLYQ